MIRPSNILKYSQLYVILWNTLTKLKYLTLLNIVQCTFNKLLITHKKLQTGLKKINTDKKIDTCDTIL